jgi:O-antigen/teichoic acid export membrane protein
VRAKHFGVIAKTRIGQAIAGVIAMLVLGLMGNSPLGLILGNIVNMGAGGGALVANAIQKRVCILPKLSSNNLLKTLIRNRRYPIFSMPEALLNIAGFQIPILIIASKAGEEAGFLMLAIQLMAAPMALLGNSISQVYISRALKEYENGSLAFFTFSIVRRLILVGTGPLIMLGVVAPIFFPSIFGVSWVRAGEIVSLLTPWMVLQFIGSPVSMVMYVVGKDRFMLLLTSIGFLMRVGGVLSAIYLLSYSPVKGLVLASACYYLLVISFVLVFSGISIRQFYLLLLAFLDSRVLIPSFLAFAIYYLT